MDDGSRKPAMAGAKASEKAASDAPKGGTHRYAPWQEAQERVLLYLKALGVPPFQSLDITAKALRSAIKEKKKASRETPTKLAMRALHDILADDHRLLDQADYGTYPILYRPWRTPDPEAAKSSGIDLEPMAAPPIDRATMPAKNIRHLSLFSLALGLIHREK